MLLGTNPTIEDILVERLGQGSFPAKGLWRHLEDIEPTSIQGVYKALRKLQGDGVVVKAGGRFSLNQEWVERVESILQPKSSNIYLEEGESVTYKFKSLIQLDEYWKHVVINLLKTLEGPVFHSEPHEMWVHLADRGDSQLTYLNSFSINKKLGYAVLGSNTYLDQEYKRTYQNEYFHIDCINQPTFIKRNEHKTIIGNVIITTIIEESLSKQIDEIYLNTKTANEREVFKQKLTLAFKHNGKVKLRIEKNLIKAKQLRKQLSKNFYIPQEIIKENNLF